LRGAAAGFLGRAGARIQIASILVQVGKDNRRIILEGVKHTITVVRIDVDIGNTREA